MDVLSLEFYIFSTIFTTVIKNVILIALIALLLGSCTKQHEPVIIPSQNPFEVMPVRFQQNVLLEYFSDETQAATVENGMYVEALKVNYPHRLFAANFHNNDFLTTSYTTHVANLLGGLINTSKGAVNRTAGKQTIGSEDGLVLLSPNNWDFEIAKQLNKGDASLSIALETGVNETNVGFINVYVAHKKALPADTRLVLYLLEDNIEPVFQQGNIPTFKHSNVLKNVLTSFEGDSIDLNTASEKGIIQKASFTSINLGDYNVANLKVIAFIYTSDADFRKRQILNVQEAGFYGLHYWDVTQD